MKSIGRKSSGRKYSGRKSIWRKSSGRKYRLKSIRRKSIRHTRNTRRLRRARRHTRKNRSMRGGAAEMTIAPSTGATIAGMQARQVSTNTAIRNLSGGGGNRRAFNQSGGDVPCCDNNNPYSYPCPTGMCGPLVQVPNAISQTSITSATMIANQASANAEFDSRPYVSVHK